MVLVLVLTLGGGDGVLHKYTPLPGALCWSEAQGSFPGQIPQAEIFILP